MTIVLESFFKDYKKGQQEDKVGENMKSAIRVTTHARSREIAKINLISSDLNKGYLPRIPAKKGIY